LIDLHVESEVSWIQEGRPQHNKELFKMVYIADFFSNFQEINIPILIINSLLESDPSNDFLIQKKFQYLMNTEDIDLIKEYYINYHKIIGENIKQLTIIEEKIKSDEGEKKLLSFYDLAFYDSLVENDAGPGIWRLRKQTLDNLYAKFELDVTFQAIFESAKLLEAKHDFLNAFDSYNKITAIDRYNFEALAAKIRIYTILEDDDKAKETYDKLIHAYELELQVAKNSDPIYDQVLSDYLDRLLDLAPMFEKHSEYTSAFYTYNKVLDYDTFNKMALEGLGNMAEKRGIMGVAIRSYETLLQFDPSNQEYKTKLDSLITEKERNE